MNPELLAAIQDNSAWLERFNRRDYAGAFRAYTERFAPAYTEAVRAAGGEETALAALADRLLDALEAGWKRQRVWNRSAVRVNDKQMVVEYLSPMLLELEPDCPRFAELLRDRWAARWPKDAYRTASHAKILGGFRFTILGFEMPKSFTDPDQEQ
ncbi:MAG: hypothetical protein Q4C45_07660 [Oscillospiraceae bacterium]|nr:hypothetical protein [Oscillospiraceae bacterium]